MKLHAESTVLGVNRLVSGSHLPVLRSHPPSHRDSVVNLYDIETLYTLACSSIPVVDIEDI